MIKIVSKTVLLVLAALSISGCAEHISERNGTKVDVVPVTYSLSLKVKPEQFKSAEKELNIFLNEHKKLILTQKITLTWRTKLGKEWVNETQKRLLIKGVSEHNITVEQNRAGFGERFDYEIKVTVHKALLSVCQYPKVGHYGEPGDGCYSESARWQSMVNPEKMLNKSLNADYTNK
ncbi:hypothetical protein ACU5DF_07750 [Aliivibrio wodanis]|uniref:Putative lipoprotein n=1 Tax=Aliivibrio wodanis TaxID=80852 RepID=A0A090I7G3_9GAMM|nr:putative lipoprotein [Aliivibrio wodanis]